jgi:hypothetical protein
MSEKSRLPLSSRPERSVVEGPAVRPGSRTKVSVPLVLSQNRHPERSASPIDRVTQRLWRGVEEPVLSVAEGTSAVLILSMLFGAFRPQMSAAGRSKMLANSWFSVPGENRGGPARYGFGG